jgi:hypothetical protein
MLQAEYRSTRAITRPGLPPRLVEGGASRRVSNGPGLRQSSTRVRKIAVSRGAMATLRN